MRMKKKRTAQQEEATPDTVKMCEEGMSPKVMMRQKNK
jgi:hypothetical protein